MPRKQSGPHILLILGIAAAVGFALLVVVLVVALFAWPGLFGGFGPLDGGLAVGEPAPVIEAAGWINGKPPSDSDLDGRVVVVEAWASW